MTTFKNIVKHNKIIYTIAVKLVVECRRIRYNFHKTFNIPFKYRIGDRGKIKLFPAGQISRALLHRSFENEEVNIYQRLVRNGMIVVDAGANIGLYSLIASKIVGSDGKVISFEPSKETYQFFVNNIVLNKLSNIVAVNMGLSDKADEKLVLRQDVGYGDAERYLSLKNKDPDITLANVNEINITEEISVDTLDNCLAKSNLRKIDFLKIDTEGFEYYILQGARQTLINSPEIIILMECTTLGTERAGTSQMQVFEYVKSFNLNIFYWNRKSNEWCSDMEGLLMAGNIWVCKDIDKLSSLNLGN